MKALQPFVKLTDTRDFDIPPGTRVRVRFLDRRSGLCQDCIVSRSNEKSAAATLREFTGECFRLRIRFKERTAVLHSPDYSWLPEPEDIVIAVVNCIVEMLSTHRSIRGRMVTRHVERI